MEKQAPPVLREVSPAPAREWLGPVLQAIAPLIPREFVGHLEVRVGPGGVTVVNVSQTFRPADLAGEERGPRG